MWGSPGSRGGGRRASIPLRIGCCRALWQGIRPPGPPIARTGVLRIDLTPSCPKRAPGRLRIEVLREGRYRGRTVLGRPWSAAMRVGAVNAVCCRPALPSGWGASRARGSGEAGGERGADLCHCDAHGS